MKARKRGKDPSTGSLRQTRSTSPPPHPGSTPYRFGNLPVRPGLGSARIDVSPATRPRFPRGLAVYDVVGRLVKALVEGEQPAGSQEKELYR